MSLAQPTETYTPTPKKGVKTYDPTAPGQRKLLAQAQLYEAELALTHGDLLQAEDVRDALSDAVLLMTRFLDALPARLRSEMGLSEAMVAQTADWLDGERTKLADAFKAMFKGNVRLKKTKRNRLV